MRRGFLVAIIVFVVVFAAVLTAATQFRLSALQEPGRTEIYLATKVKHILVHKDSRSVPLPPATTPASVAEGRKLYGAECAVCHGLDGRTATDAGRWMYPRAANLASPDVQAYSDQDLFWIVKNGIRFSGMPAFGKVESDEHIWNLTHYVRTLPVGSNPH